MGQALQRLMRQWQEQLFSLQTRQFKMAKETPRPCQGHSTRSICTANGTMSSMEAHYYFVGKRLNRDNAFYLLHTKKD